MSTVEAPQGEPFLLVAKAIGFLSEHRSAKPTLKQVADHVGLSEFHFQRMFVEWAGVSPKEFMQALSLERAKAALAQGVSTLGTTMDVGLSSQSRLHDLFLTAESMTPGDFKAGGAGVEIFWCIASTKFGPALFAQTGHGICRISFVEGENQALTELVERWPNATLTHSADQLESTVQELQSRMMGRAPEKTLGLLLSGSPLRMKVWQALLEAPSGTLLSYQTLAHAAGTKAVRAVATAVAANPLAYLIPCHRVIRAAGAFGEYHWGADRKLAMIGAEQHFLTDI